MIHFSASPKTIFLSKFSDKICYLYFEYISGNFPTHISYWRWFPNIFDSDVYVSQFTKMNKRQSAYFPIFWNVPWLQYHMGKNWHKSFNFPKPCKFFYSESWHPHRICKVFGGNSSPQTPEIFDLSTKQEPETPYSLLRLQFVKYSIYAQINCYLSWEG